MFQQSAEVLSTTVFSIRETIHRCAASACNTRVLRSAGGKRTAVELFDEGRLLMFQNDSSVPDWAQVPSDPSLAFVPYNFF